MIEDSRAHLPWRVLRIGERVKIDHRRAERGGDVRGAGVVRDQEVGLVDEGAELAQPELADEHAARLSHGLAHGLDELGLGGVAGKDGFAAGLGNQQVDGARVLFRRVATRGGARARMHDDERTQPGAREARDATLRRGRYAEGEMLVARRAADRRGEIELPAHLVPHESARLGVRDPVAEQLIGVLVAVRKPPRDAGEVAHISGRQRILAPSHSRHRQSQARPHQHGKPAPHRRSAQPAKRGKSKVPRVSDRKGWQAMRSLRALVGTLSEHSALSTVLTAVMFWPFHPVRSKFVAL